MNCSTTLLAAALLFALGGCASDQKSGTPTSKPAAQHAHGKGHKHAHPSGAMHHRFKDADKWAKRFDSPKRAGWQKPAAVIKKLALDAAAHVADVGAGTGYFTVLLARAASKGTVYAIDVEPTMVKYLGERARREGLANVRPLLASTSDAKIPAPVDMVFICDTYHHIGDRSDYFRKVAKQIKPGGRLVIVDFKMGKIPVGPPEKHRVTPDKLHAELSAAGYKKVELDDKTLPYQYIAIYSPKKK